LLSKVPKVSESQNGYDNLVQEDHKGFQGREPFTTVRMFKKILENEGRCHDIFKDLLERV